MMKKQLNILDYAFLICIISIFIKFTFFYPILFLFFVFLNTCNEFKKRKLNIYLNKWQIILSLFSMWVLLVNIISDNHSLFYLIKFLINILFLISVPIYLRGLGKRLSKVSNKVFNIIEWIIFVTFGQILFLYIVLNILSSIFQGISNSDMAYIITSRPDYIFFGSESKNIWSTKIALIQIIYLLGTQLKVYTASSNKVKFVYIISVLNVLMLLGRTAQLAYLIALLYFVISKIIKSKKAIYIYSGITLMMVLMYKLIPILYDKVFHINFNITDGGYIRLQYWITFFKYFDHTDYVLGNGFLYAQFFLKHYAQLYIGETNMHNVMLNNLLDWGIIGAVLYSIFFISLMRNIFRSIQQKLLFFFCVIIPLITIMSLQYLGYDNDLVVFWCLLILVSNKFYQQKNIQKERLQ